MSKIDAILFSLLDGKWHNLSEITNMLSIDRWRVEKVVNLLADFAFIHINESDVRITSETKEFLVSTSQGLRAIQSTKSGQGLPCDV